MTSVFVELKKDITDTELDALGESGDLFRCYAWLIETLPSDALPPEIAGQRAHICEQLERAALNPHHPAVDTWLNLLGMLIGAQA
jgi:hypothetical protein